MSKKTMKQRIALVAVSALTAGLFSVVSTPAANAAAGDTAADTLALQITNSTTGAVVQTAGGGDTAADKSVGFVTVTSATGTDQVAVGSTAMGIKAGSTGTAVALSTSVLMFSASNGSTQNTDNLVISVSGGTVASTNSEAATAQPTLAYNGSSTATSMALNANSNNSMSTQVRPNAGVTSMTVQAWKGASATAAAPSLGTLLGQWVITIATASGAGTFSPAFSFVGTTPLATTAAIASSVDVSTSSVYAGAPLFIQVIGKNAYGQALTTGTYTATSTNNAVINWGVAANATAAGSLTIASKTSSGSDQLRIDPASALTTTTTTITISHDGVPVTTRTLTFYGEVKSIVIESVKAGQVGTAIGAATATAYATYSMRDSAGGKVNAPAALFNAVTANSTITAGAATTRLPRRSTQTTAPDQVTSAVAALIGSGADGVFAFTCGSTPGKNNANITHVNAISGATITAEVKDIGCYGPLATYTVSTDKAKYAVGEIATITILGKDAVGNPVPDMQTLTANSISVGGGALTVTVAASDVFTAGKAEYKAQMTTAGTFNVVVSLPGLTTTSATAGYSVTSGDVTNAAVLQSIVALIASINKQIAALQKLILARR